MKYTGYLIVLGVFILPVICSGASPGDIIKSQTFGLPFETEYGYGLDISSGGNLTISGVAYIPDSINPGWLGNGDVWVMRLDQNGTVLWERIYGGNQTDYGLSVHGLPDGGAAVLGTTGSYNGDVTNFHGQGDMWFLRLDNEGNIIWDRALGGDQMDEGSDFVLTPDGDYLLCGYTLSDNGDLKRQLGDGDLWLVRINDKGIIVWQQTYGGSGKDSGAGICSTKDGAYVICGSTNSTDGMVKGNRTSSDVWVIKVDQNGTLLWEEAFGGSELDWGHSVIELSTGDIMVGGVTASGDGDVGTNHGAADIWLMKLSPEGKMLWQQTYGGAYSDNVWRLVPSLTGGAYLVGDSFSQEGMFNGNHGESDLLVGEVDKNGTLLWQRQIGGSSIDRGSWMDKTSDERLLISGLTTSSDGDLSGNHTAGDLWVLEVQGSLPVNLERPGPLNGTGPIPTDPDGDGKYEDLNGNGRIDLQDPSTFFQYFNWIKENSLVSQFDFNNNSVLELGDIQALFSEVKA